MKIVVTGSSGRVGRAIFVRLARQHEVIGIDRLPASTVHHVGDIGDRALLQRALEGSGAVVHVAALHAPHVGVLPDAEFQRINVDATHGLLEVARDSGVTRLVFTSSTAVFGAAAALPDRAGWVDETLAPQPETIYHRSKLEAEALLRDAAASGGPSVRILRMSRCFPEPAPVMAAYRLHRGVDARDVADAHERALRDQGPAHATWVISGATPFQREDTEELRHDAPAVLVRRAPKLVADFAARGWPLPACIDRVYDASAAARDLGWRPRFGHAEVLAQYDAESSEVLPPARHWAARE